MSDDTSQRDESADEIEVTPEMVDAGIRFVAEHHFAFVLCDDEEESRLAIKQAFEAMLRVHRRSLRRRLDRP